MKTIKWSKCQKPAEFVCDVCGRCGTDVDWIEHVADYTRSERVRDPYTNQIGSIAVCCDCLSHKDRLIEEFYDGT